MAEEQKPPILRIGAADFTALVGAGFGLVCLHNEIVGVVKPIPPVKFRRGATKKQIMDAWREWDGYQG